MANVANPLQTAKAVAFRPSREFEEIFTIDKDKCSCLEDYDVNFNDVMGFPVENVSKCLKNVNKSSTCRTRWCQEFFHILWLAPCLSFSHAMLFKSL